MKSGICRSRLRALRQRIFRTQAEDSLPHTVTHQRVYIVPSKRGCAFLFTLLLMLIASVNYALSLGYALSFLLTGLFAATLLHTYRNLAGLRINAITGNDTFAGEDVVFHIKLGNPHARICHGIRVGTGSNSTLVQIPPNDNAEAIITFNAASRGICRLGRLTLQSDWPIGLWTSWSYLHVEKQVLVFPQPEDKVPPLPNKSGAEKGNLTHLANTGDVSGLREYQPGDSIGSIAWKSTARGLGLQTRTFDNEKAHSETVLDLRHAAVPGVEAQLSRLCAWVLQAEHTQTDYSFQLPNFSLEKNRGKEQQAQALRALALYGMTSHG